MPLPLATKLSTLQRCPTPSSAPHSPPTVTPQVIPVPLPLVTDISTLRISIPADLRPAEARKAGASCFISLASETTHPHMYLQACALHVNQQLELEFHPRLPHPHERLQHASAVLLTLRELAKRYPGAQLPLLDPIADMGIQDEKVGR